MSTLASFEFKHLHRPLKPEENIPPFPSLAQQIEALAQDARRGAWSHEEAESEEIAEPADPAEAEDDAEE